MGISSEEVVWAYRCLLGRDPNELDIKHQSAHVDLASLRQALLNTGEFNAIHNRPYAIPEFLVPDPKEGKIEILIPSLEEPVCQLCTSEQAAEIHYQQFCEVAGYPPEILHRKYWEWAYVYRVVEHAGLLGHGARGLVFAVGTEPLPAMFVAKGCRVLASDGPQDAMEAWQASGEHSSTLDGLLRPSICSEEKFRENVEFRTINMLDLPDDIGGFDFLWSSCSLEHLGGIEAGGRFVRDAMRYLRPGGLAVHTTEFNLSSNADTVDGSPTCIFRKRDLERLTEDLIADGHAVQDWNFWPGSDGERDSHIDFPPFAPPHLKLALYQYIATSVGLIATKGGAESSKSE